MHGRHRRFRSLRLRPKAVAGGVAGRERTGRFQEYLRLALRFGPPGDASYCAPDRQLPPSRTVPVSAIRPASMRPRGERSPWSHARPQPLDRSGLARRAPASHPSPCVALPAPTGHSSPPKQRHMGETGQAPHVPRRRRAAVPRETLQSADTERGILARGDPSGNLAASARDRRSFVRNPLSTSLRIARPVHRRRYERVLRWKLRRFRNSSTAMLRIRLGTLRIERFLRPREPSCSRDSSVLSMPWEATGGSRYAVRNPLSQ